MTSKNRVLPQEEPLSLRSHREGRRRTIGRVGKWIPATESGRHRPPRHGPEKSFFLSPSNSKCLSCKLNCHFSSWPCYHFPCLHFASSYVCPPYSRPANAFHYTVYSSRIETNCRVSRWYQLSFPRSLSPTSFFHTYSVMCDDDRPALFYYYYSFISSLVARVVLVSPRALTRTMYRDNAGKNKGEDK